jgi:hypothetical protein
MFEKIFSASPEHPRAIPVIPCIGNNDVQPHNYIKLNDEVLPFFENLWDQWIPKDQRKYFLEGGYFAADVAPHLRVLSINTMYFLKKNPFAKSCQRKSSPGHAHFVWYKQQLEKARKDNVKVYVIGHVPPSPREFLSSCLTDYLSITAEYPDVVYGHFYSHLNMDHFLLYDKREQEIHSSADEEEFIEKEVQSKPLNIPFLEDSHTHDDEVTIQRNVLEYIGWLETMYDDIDEFENKHPDRHKKKHSVQRPFDSEPVVAIHVAPSVFPVYMPAIRIYRYEINDAGKRPFGALLGYSQYVSNITTYNNEQRHKNPRDPLNYTLEYDTSTLYGLSDLSVDTYIEFADILTKKDDPVSKKLWSTYVNNVFVQTQNNTFSHLLK